MAILAYKYLLTNFDFSTHIFETYWSTKMAIVASNLLTHF